MGLKGNWFSINKNYNPLYVKNEEFITSAEYYIIRIASQEIKVIFKSVVLPQGNGTIPLQKLCKAPHVAELIGFIFFNFSTF